MEIINEHFKDKGLKKVATKEVGSKTLGVFSIFDSQVRLILPMLGQKMFIDNKKSKELLGLKYERDLKKTLIEMVDAMIKHGILKVDNSEGCFIF